MKKQSCLSISVFCAILFCIATPLANAVASDLRAVEVSTSYEIVKSLPFCPDSSELTLDLYLPQTNEQKFPCILVIQGGGYKARDGQGFKPFAEYIASRGMAAALISYRGLPEDNYLTTIADAKDAVRFVRKHAPEYHIDPDKIGAMGRSAGGVLTALLAVTDDEDFQRSPRLDTSSEIQAAVTFCGVFNFISRFTEQEQIDAQKNVSGKIGYIQKWLMEPFDVQSDAWQKVSAEYYLDQDLPPMLLLHCKDDKVVPWQQSRDFYSKAKERGLSVEAHFFPTGGHGLHVKPNKDLPMQLMVDFFKRVFQ